MRDFDIHRHTHGHRFGGRSMSKPLLLGVVLVAVLGLLVMSLWNALLPALLGVKSIGFWQALGILVLCRILFGGLGFRPGMFGMAREHRRMHQRWMQMTPEQREQFIRQRHQGFGRHGHHHAGGHAHWREHDRQPAHDTECGTPREAETHRQPPEDNYLSEVVWNELQEALSALPPA
ncbi:hypothetical protein PMPD1_2955 [Paramixta manurensis]|uniref:Uncharacterized protein n=1 Tax=Paramixta manurensis TaxID=2740817 RepID=A0A6M8UJE2_9GAMM|nr:hypothetical protein PMPD1_2955 [Erwiniaceae bacterium PD-1]